MNGKILNICQELVVLNIGYKYFKECAFRVGASENHCFWEESVKQKEDGIPWGLGNGGKEGIRVN
jgi:hypothetical protein